MDNQSLKRHEERLFRVFFKKDCFDVWATNEEAVHAKMLEAVKGYDLKRSIIKKHEL